jgi:hypothetical protein
MTNGEVETVYEDFTVSSSLANHFLRYGEL